MSTMFFEKNFFPTTINICKKCDIIYPLDKNNFCLGCFYVEKCKQTESMLSKIEKHYVRFSELVRERYFNKRNFCEEHNN